MPFMNITEEFLSSSFLKKLSVVQYRLLQKKHAESIICGMTLRKGIPGYNLLDKTVEYQTNHKEESTSHHSMLCTLGS